MPRAAAHTQNRALGIVSVLAALLVLLSLLSHSAHADSNWLGVCGHGLARTLQYLLGLGAFLIPAALLWVGLHQVRGFPLRHRWLFYWMGILLSICLIFTVLANAFPGLGMWVRSLVPTNMVTHVSPIAYREVRFYLGGVPLAKLYADLPFLNLRRLLSPIGTTLLAVALGTFCLALLTEFQPLAATRSVWNRLKMWWQARLQKSPPPPKPIRISEPEPEPVTSVVLTEKPRAISERAKPRPAIPRPRGGYKLPPSDLLTPATKLDQSTLKKGLRHQAEVLGKTLASFGIEAEVGEIHCGPTITSFEVHPAVGVKVQKIKALEKDLALNMRARAIRIIAPIPGKAAVGVEIPNPRAQEVSLREMLTSYQNQNVECRIPLLLGKAVNGDDMFADLVKMPHLMIAGATGSGKSVCLNTLIMTILMTARPDEIKLLMVDPKKVELAGYSALPHMLAPVITEPKEACIALHWLVREMETRYELLRVLGVRNIDAFNSRKRDPEKEEALEIEVPERLPFIVAIIDELADLMMVSSSDIETPITRIAQMARAVGIHLVLATQRPSREVLTGLIKANFPTRLAFKVSSRVNSQIILDEPGAEALLGNGDMLFRPPGTHYLTRAQGPYVRDGDINGVIDYITQQAPPDYQIDSFCNREDLMGQATQGSGDRDDLYERAYDLIVSAGVASTTYLQRKLKIGYARAASIMDQLEENGVVAPADGSKARRLLVTGK